MRKLALGTTLTAVLVGGLCAQEGSEIKDRRENQQDRIAQGVKSGQLTAGETARLEGQEAKINHETHYDRKVNGGNLTDKEKAKVNHQLNRESARIYNKKHNAATGPR